MESLVISECGDFFSIPLQKMIVANLSGCRNHCGVVVSLSSC